MSLESRYLGLVVDTILLYNLPTCLLNHANLDWWLIQFFCITNPQLDKPENAPGFAPNKTQPIKFAILCSGTPSFATKTPGIYLTQLKQASYPIDHHISKYTMSPQICQPCIVSWVFHLYQSDIRSTIRYHSHRHE